MKKLLSILLIISFVFSFATVNVSAEEQKGSITIAGVNTNSEGKLTTTYTIYKMLDLTSYKLDEGKYAYKVANGWEDFFKTSEALQYVDADEAGNVSWKTTVDTDGATVGEFAKIALEWAKVNNINKTDSADINDYEPVTVEGKKIVKFEGLDIGYYLLDSTLGALCGLTTTNPDAVVNAKNVAPTMNLQVQEDLTLAWGKTNTADIGQIVNFLVNVEVHAGAENYVIHTEKTSSFKNYAINEIIWRSGTIQTILQVEQDYTIEVNNNSSGECALEIHFEKELCDKLKTNDKIEVYYEAMLTKDAIIAGEGNIARAWVSFGENGENHITEKNSTTTYTYSVDIVKTDGQYKLLGGAGFRIYDAPTGGNEVSVVLLTDGGNTYRKASATETGVEIVVGNIESDKTSFGQAVVIGLDNGDYYIEETSYPEGYNPLTGRQKFTISSGNLEATFINDTYSTGSGVHVVNKTGEMLPETGSMGTTAFITFGSIVALATGVLLVTKKRMSMIDD